MEPAPLDRLRRGLREVPIAKHHRWAPVHDLADLAGANVLALVIDQPGLHVDDGLAYRTPLAVGVVPGENARHRAHLRLAEEAEHGHIRQRARNHLQLLRGRARRPPRDAPQAERYPLAHDLL